MREAETVTVVARIYPKAGPPNAGRVLLPGPLARPPVDHCHPRARAPRGAAGVGWGDGVSPARRRRTTSGSGRPGRRRRGLGRLTVVEDARPPHSALRVPHTGRAPCRYGRQERGGRRATRTSGLTSGPEPVESARTLPRARHRTIGTGGAGRRRSGPRRPPPPD